MKKSMIIYVLMAVLVITGYSCKKDLDDVTLNPPNGITGFNASVSQVVLSGANDSTTVVTFKWNMPDYGFKAATSFALLFDAPSDTSGANAWSNAVKVSLAANTLQKAYLGTDFNKIINQLGLPNGSASTLAVRLVADVNQSTGLASAVTTLYTSTTMTVTPYKVILIYPKLYIAGDFLTPQWTQFDQPGWILAAPKSDGAYEGYIDFTSATNKFKLCTAPNWNGTNYGIGASATTMSSAGNADNLVVTGAGYYKVNADVSAMTFAATPTVWRMAGDFNGWSLLATKMTYNATTKVWTATGVSITSGTKFKFVGDDSWGIELGVDSKDALVNKGGNITAAKTGTFTVTLDLSGGAGNYNYTMQ